MCECEVVFAENFDFPIIKLGLKNYLFHRILLKFPSILQISMRASACLISRVEGQLNQSLMLFNHQSIYFRHMYFINYFVIFIVSFFLFLHESYQRLGVYRLHNHLHQNRKIRVCRMSVICW